MRPLDGLSGPWDGWSIQDSLRITESLELQIGLGEIRGAGSDKDGDFVIEGTYGEDGRVRLTRRYTYCTAGPSGIGIPYRYRGQWDGTLISGRWNPVGASWYGGEFEMWPREAEEETERAEERQVASATG